MLVEIVYIVPGGLLLASPMGNVNSFGIQKSNPPGLTKLISGVLPMKTEIESYEIHPFCPVTASVILNKPALV